MNKENKGMFKELVEFISNWDYAKEMLFVKAVPVNEVKMNALRKVIGDIALTVGLMLDDSESYLTTAVITKDLVRTWGKSEDEVWNLAFKGTMSPAVMSFDSEDIFDPRVKFIGLTEYRFTDPYLCLTNKKTMNGAVSIFLPGVAATICNGLHTRKIYITFTSKHEAMCHYPNMDPSDLKAITTDTMNTAGTPEDFLSNSVYEYDTSRKEFRIIA